MGGLSIWHILILAIVVVLIMGRGKISELMGDVARGIKNFREGLKDDSHAIDKPDEAKKDKPVKR
jgi:sec-independent protein translocase protein TatA